MVRMTGPRPTPRPKRIGADFSTPARRKAIADLKPQLRPVLIDPRRHRAEECSRATWIGSYAIWLLPFAIAVFAVWLLVTA